MAFLQNIRPELTYINLAYAGIVKLLSKGPVFLDPGNDKFRKQPTSRRLRGRNDLPSDLGSNMIPHAMSREFHLNDEPAARRDIDYKAIWDGARSARGANEGFR